MGPGDDGSLFRCTVTNGFGSVDTRDAVLTVVENRPPAPAILLPAPGSNYNAGDALQFSGSALDPEDGELGPSAFSWRIDFHHGDHTHPAMPETKGVKQGEFPIPSLGELSPAVWYRVHLSVTDSGGLAATTHVDVHPNTAVLTFSTEPAGLQILLDSTPRGTPLAVTGVAGMQRLLGVPSPQTSGGRDYVFEAWSDGGPAMHEITTPLSDTAMTATFRELPPEEELLVVNWGGDYVREDTACRRGWTTEGSVNLGKGSPGTNDTRAYFPLSHTEPLSPHPASGYRDGTSSVFYGGVLLHAYDRGFTQEKWTEVWDRELSDQIYYSTRDAGTDGWGLFYWKKEDFLSGSALGSLRFGSGSRLEILNYQGGDGVVEKNSGRVRFVVDDGEQFYVSESYGDRSSASFALTDPAGERWAPFDPQPPHSFQLDEQTAQFAEHEFQDITAVGFYHSNSQSTEAMRRAGFTAARFRAQLSSRSGGLQAPGDCNGDGTADISDAVCVLLHLFAGPPTPVPCGGESIREGGNIELLSFNGDGAVDISDAIALLTHLFLGGAGHPLGKECARIAGCPDVCR